MSEQETDSPDQPFFIFGLVFLTGFATAQEIFILKCCFEFPILRTIELFNQMPATSIIIIL